MTDSGEPREGMKSAREADTRQRDGEDRSISIPVHWSEEPVRPSEGSLFLQYPQRERNVYAFLELAERWNERTYLVQGDERWTFADVRTEVERKARTLVSMGLDRGSPLLILGWNSVDWVIGFWATLLAGGYVVTGNAWWSDDELEHAIRVAEPSLVLTDSPDRVTAGRVISFSDLEADELPTTLLPDVEGDEEAPAVALFTSGTTGFPKAALLSHRAVVAGIHGQLALTNRLPQQLDDDHPVQVTLQTGPMFHIGGVQAILRAPLLGARLVLTAGKFDPEEVLGLIQREGVHRWAGVVPTMATRVLDHPTLGSYDLTSVRSLTLGGTVVSDGVMQRVRQAFPSARESVKTGWGLSEAGGQLTAASGKETLEHPGSVGRALPFVELRILDPDERGVGEVLARSPMQMTGYLGEESESPIDAEGWLHTGDLGRIDEDGWLWLEGRSKDLIIRGGENIAVARVEQVLLQHDTVREVAVVSLPHSDLGEIVAAAVVLKPDETVREEELAEYAARHLSKFAVPTEWLIQYEPLPTNEVGKVAKSVIRDQWQEMMNDEGQV